MKHTTQPQESKEPLGITPGEWDIGYSNKSNSFGIFTKRMMDYGYEEPPICLISPVDQLTETDKANAQAICTAVNSTYKKGYDPLQVDALYKALEATAKEYEYAMKTFSLVSGQVYSPNNVIISAKQALGNAKL